MMWIGYQPKVELKGGFLFLNMNQGHMVKLPWHGSWFFLFIKWMNDYGSFHFLLQTEMQISTYYNEIHYYPLLLSYANVIEYLQLNIHFLN